MVFDHPEYDSHEQVVFFNKPSANLRAIIAIHNTVRGPALGGCRMYPYASEAEALTDVLRLAKGMSYKSSISGLPLGGGKSVIIGDPRTDKTEALFEAFGQCLNQLGGRYIVAEDSGTSVDDLRIIASQSRFISGLGERPMPGGGVADGDPSPATAYGVFMGIEAAVRAVLKRSKDLKGLTVAVQGVGNVGRRLVEHLTKAGAKVIISDAYPDRLNQVAQEFGAEMVGVDEIYSALADVFSPCALGAVLNDDTIPQLQAKIVAGAANNQLAKPKHADHLRRQGIVYVPDFAINAGGVIDIAGYQKELSYSASMQEVACIYDTVMNILREAEKRQCTTLAVAEALAERGLQKKNN